MPRFGFVGPSYRSQSVSADCQVCKNWYVETIESGQGKSALALYRTPGLKLLYQLNPAGVRGEITVQGRTFTVVGTNLWELLAPAAVPNKILRGEIVSDGQPVSMAGGANQGLIASGGNLYHYDAVANVLTLVPQFDASTGLGLLGPVSQVVYMDGFFYALIQNSNQIQASNPLDGLTWQGVSETQVSVFSDNVIAIYVNAERVWVAGSNNIQVYFDSGNFPFPLDTVDGGFIEQGIAAPFSFAKLDNSIFWLGQDSRGNGIVWRANGYSPVRVSTHALEYALSTYATITDAVCYAYQDQGHTFYVMNFPTAQKTWVYDCATQMWHERGFWNKQAGVYTQSRAGFHTFNFGMHLVGDPTTGAVYQQSIAFLSDFGNVIRRERAAPHISNEQAFVFHQKLQVDVETGVGPVPPLQGSAVPTSFALEDANGNLWNLGMGEGGILQAPSLLAGSAEPVSVFLNDQENTTSWRITASIAGAIEPVQIPFDPGLPAAISFVSALGDQRWSLQLENQGAGVGILQTIPLGIVGRGPQMTLVWSDDGGHTWSNEHTRDCGQAGRFNVRVLWNRLGRSRDRVYKIIVTDPVPWAIIDAYLFTDPADREPKERFAATLRKQA